MRRQNQKIDRWQVSESVEWPESTVELDDAAFARAIAEGRRSDVAA